MCKIIVATGFVICLGITICLAQSTEKPALYESVFYYSVVKGNNAKQVITLDMQGKWHISSKDTLKVFSQPIGNYSDYFSDCIVSRLKKQQLSDLLTPSSVTCSFSDYWCSKIAKWIGKHDPIIRACGLLNWKSYRETSLVQSRTILDG